MSLVNCPYKSCDHLYTYEGDCEDFTQDSEQTFTCPKCNCDFVATVYWDLVITNEKEKEPPA